MTVIEQCRAVMGTLGQLRAVEIVLGSFTHFHLNTSDFAFSTRNLWSPKVFLCKPGLQVSVTTNLPCEFDSMTC